VSTEADYWVLKDAGFFEDHNDGATWLQEHKDDPYWMAHQLTDALRLPNEPWSSEQFIECWKLAREIHGIES
jgi:hypothetical protein